MESNENKVEANGVETGDAPALKLPEWVNEKNFESLLKEQVAGFKKICNFKAFPGLAPGENYATLMLRVEIEVELEDGAKAKKSYMLKTPHSGEQMDKMIGIMNFFKIEGKMYQDIVPEFEQMYADAGVEVKFCSGCYKLNLKQNYVLLEDLKNRGFKNTNRLEGLDMAHTKCVLKKLAQWHAASATRIETKGKYDDIFMRGFFNETQKEMMESVFNTMAESFLKCLRTYKGHEQFAASVEKLSANATKELFKAAVVNPNEFNVLNHGDCWSNNIMFRYNEDGTIAETLMVDYQLPTYGTPAQDLQYLLLSSTSYELKLKEFDYFIKFYHDHLLEALNLLKYPKKLPTLKDLHISLIKNSIWGYHTVATVMAAILCDPTENASLENFISESKDADDFKMLMYSNARYRKHMEAILPWLQNRGALEF